MDETVDKLIATMETSAPEALTHGPKDFVNLIDYQPIALFHRLITRNREAFAETLAEALTHHSGYRGDSAAPRAQVVLGPPGSAAYAPTCHAAAPGRPVVDTVGHGRRLRLPAAPRLDKHTTVQ